MAGIRLGALSCAHYLSYRIGMSLGVAREKVRVARALASLPRIDAALARGQLSYSKVRAITRVATADNEEALLETAMASTAAQLEKICRLYRQTAPRERAADERRWLSHQVTDDGMVRISIQLRPEEAATVLRAIDGSAESGSQADRVVALAETALSGPRADGQVVRPPVEVMFHIDAGTLAGHAHHTGDGVSAEVTPRQWERCALPGPVLWPMPLSQVQQRSLAGLHEALARSHFPAAQGRRRGHWRCARAGKTTALRAQRVRSAVLPTVLAVEPPAHR